MRWRIPLAAVLALFVAASCQEAPVEPAADQVAGITFNWLNNPDNGNPRIFRGETHWISCWSDSENGLRACHGTLPLGGGSEPDCGLQEEGDLIEFQDVGIFNPDDPFSSWIHEVVKGDVWITVRDLNTPGTCFGAALVAEGWGRFMYVDNDIFGTTVNNTNTWKFRGHGNLTAPDGSRVNYNGHIKLMFGPNVPGRINSAVVNAH